MNALTHSRPWRELVALERRMEDWFERFGDRLGDRFSGPREHERSFWDNGAWSPALESRVDNGNLIVKADLPGVDPKEVSISVIGNQLRIEGERKHEEKHEEKDYFYQELEYGKFVRTLPLPAEVDADQIKARYKKGVLEITMPAPKELSAKKISIDAS